MSDLTTTYLNLKLEHPVVASASPLSRTLAGIRRLEDAGAAAIVLFSLFEEQIVFDGDDVATALMPGLVEPEDAVTPEGYLELVEAAKRAVDIPIIASLNGTTDAGCTRYSRAVQQAGPWLHHYASSAAGDGAGALPARRYSAKSSGRSLSRMPRMVCSRSYSTRMNSTLVSPPSTSSRT